MKDTQLAWLAGLWDGEGSITIFSHTEKNGTKKLCPTLLVVNTDMTIIAEAKKLLDELDTSFHLFERRTNNPKHKNAFQLSTRNAGYIEKVLTAILPYLVGKKAQAELTLQYVKKRAHQHHYDEQDIATQETVQAMNRRGK
jgi:hypothetical protein